MGGRRRWAGLDSSCKWRRPEMTGRSSQEALRGRRASGQTNRAHVQPAESRGADGWPSQPSRCDIQVGGRRRCCWRGGDGSKRGLGVLVKAATGGYETAVGLLHLFSGAGGSCMGGSFLIHSGRVGCTRPTPTSPSSFRPQVERQSVPQSNLSWSFRVAHSASCRARQERRSPGR